MIWSMMLKKVLVIWLVLRRRRKLVFSCFGNVGDLCFVDF